MVTVFARNWGMVAVRGPLALLFGLLTIAVGLITFFMPGVTAIVLLYFIAALAILRGIAEITMAIHLRKVLEGEWLLGLAGAISLLFGIFLVVAPGAGALAILLWIGVWAVIFGVVVLALAFRLRAWNQTLAAG